MSSELLPLRVIVVDDEPLARRLMRAMLEDAPAVEVAQRSKRLLSNKAAAIFLTSHAPQQCSLSRL